MEIEIGPKERYISILQEAMQGKLSESGKKTSAAALSRKLELTPTFVHFVLKGKTRLPLERADQFAEALKMPSLVREEFIRLVAASAAKGSQRKVSEALLGSEDLSEKYKEGNPVILNEMNEWYYFAILDLVGCVGFQASIPWIANRLELDSMTVANAIGRLEGLGLLERVEDGWKKKDEFLTFSQRYSSGQLARIHKGFMERAKLELDKTHNLDFVRREISGITMTADQSKVDQIRKEIRAFRRKINQIAGTGKPSEVYHLGIQFVPITKRETDNA